MQAEWEAERTGKGEWGKKWEVEKEKDKKKE
jgi:hypothetical protein